MPSLRAVLKQAAARLTAAGVDSPRLSAELLLAHCLNIPREKVILHLDDSLSQKAAQCFEILIQRRETGEPVAYILGRKEFFGLDFVVKPDVLIPRPETELLAEQALRAFEADKPVRFADLGTGSGILPVVLAVHRPYWRGVGLDTSAAALAVARSNARSHSVAERLAFCLADFWRRLPLHNLDLIVSNPPYVSQEEYSRCSREVRDFEPESALTAGVTGLESLEALLPHAREALRPGGLLLVELGFDQGSRAQDMAKTNGLSEIDILPDLAGHDRVLRCRA